MYCVVLFEESVKKQKELLLTRAYSEVKIARYECVISYTIGRYTKLIALLIANF